MAGRLNDGVLLCVQTATQLMALTRGNLQPLPQTAGLITMTDTGGRAVVAGGQDIAILHQQRPHLTAQAGGTGCHQMRDIDKILIPGWTGHSMLTVLNVMYTGILYKL